MQAISRFQHIQLVKAVFATAELNSIIMEFVHFLDLPCLIRVSKDLSEQALRILWKILPSPLPLLKLFKNFTLFERTWVSSDRIN